MGAAENTKKRLAAFYKSVFKKELKMGSYDERIALQKLVYLLKSTRLGFDEYRFSWYLRGPYSPVLALDAFSIVEEGIQPVLLSEKDKSQLRQLDRILEGDLNDVSALELNASILYLLNERFGWDASDFVIVEEIKTLKPWFSVKEIQPAVKKIKEHKKLFNA